MTAPPGALDYARRAPLRAWTAVVLLFLYLPLGVLIAFSFNESRRSVKWTGFSLEWYARLLGDRQLLDAFVNSLTIATISTAVSLVLGALLATALWRFRFPFKPMFEGLVTLPIAIPEICMGVAMLAFFSKVVPWPMNAPWPIDLGAIIIAHISFSFPFVAVIVRARLASFNVELEEAARDLGASDYRAFIDVLIPHMRPALIAGALLAFTLSLDDFVITFFTSGPNTVTFPVKVYSMVRFSVTPEVNAASTILIVLTTLLTVVGIHFQGKDAGKAGM